MKKFLIVGVVVVVLAAGLGYAAMRFLGPAADNAVEVVPDEAFFYANIFLNPSTGQKLALEDLLAKFPQAGTPDEAKDFIASFIDEGFASEGIDATFEGDIEPWLGPQVAVYFSAPRTEREDPTGAVLFASEDNDAAMEFVRKLDTDDVDLEEREYEGVEYFADLGGDGVGGIIGDFLVFGDDAAFKAIIDAPNEGTLADSQRYENAISELRRDRVALAYFDPKPIFDLARRSGEIPPNIPPAFMSVLEQPFVASAFLRSDAFVLELAQRAPSGPLAPIAEALTSEGGLETLPVNTWAAFTIPEVGRFFDGFIDAFSNFGFPGFTRAALAAGFRAGTGFDLEQDVLSWPGDLSGFVLGNDLSSLGGGVVIESKDPQASARAVAKLQLLLRREGAPVRALSADFRPRRGFAIQDRSMPEPINVIEDGDQVMAVYGSRATQDLLSPGPLGNTPEFMAAKEALGADFSMTFYVSLHPILVLAENLGAENDPGYLEVKPFLEPLGFVTAGSRLSGDSLIQRFVIGVE